MMEELLSARRDIAALLEGMLAGRPLDRSDSFVDLCELAAQQSDERQEVDIEAWAERLSQDLGKFTD